MRFLPFTHAKNHLSPSPQDARTPRSNFFSNLDISDPFKKEKKETEASTKKERKKGIEIERKEERNKGKEKKKKEIIRTYKGK